ncbi:hypothetical protein HY251_17525 [bacterium]|nr:hypothetical protein [bacterium]
MRHVGAALQALGLLLLPAGLIFGVQGGDTRTELALLGVGVCAFLAGKLIVDRKAS